MTNLHRIKLTDNYVKPKFFTMNEDDKRMFLALVKGKDISEIMSLLAESGNQYSRRILRFFRWFCKWVPFFIMLTHMYGIFDFAVIRRRCLWCIRQTGRVTHSYTSWSMYCRWLLFLRHASFGYVGGIAYRSSTSLLSTRFISYIGVGTRPTR